MPVDMTPIKSSNIEGVSYDAASRQMTIQFIGGAQYVYEDVPRSRFEGIVGAQSAGSYLHSEIKGNYKFRKVDAQKR